MSTQAVRMGALHRTVGPKLPNNSTESEPFRRRALISGPARPTSAPGLPSHRLARSRRKSHSDGHKGRLVSTLEYPGVPWSTLEY